MNKINVKSSGQPCNGVNACGVSAGHGQVKIPVDSQRLAHGTVPLEIHSQNAAPRKFCGIYKCVVYINVHNI